MILALLPWVQAGSLDALPSVVGPGEDAGPVLAIPAGDLDGDGLGDLALGAPADDGAGHEAGAVWVIFDVAGLQPFTPLEDVGVALRGEQPQDRAGSALAALGDTDGDGLGDLAVGAPEADTEVPAGGRVYLLSGAELAPGTLATAPKLLGSSRWGRVGARVFGPGDLDGDGLADLLVGAPHPTPSGDLGVGWLGVVLAPARGWPEERRVGLEVTGATVDMEGLDAAFYARESETLMGRSAARVPDQDGDGVMDLLVGAPGVGGHAHLAPPSDTGHGGGSTGHADGAAWLFTMSPSPRGMGAVEVAAAAAMIMGEDLEALPWQLLALSDGRVVLSAPEGGRVYAFAALADAVTSDADVLLEGSAADLTGWGLAEGPGGLWISEPGFDGARGRVLGRSILTSGPVDDDAVALEGCHADGQAGLGLAGHPGPDPFGRASPWAAVTAPMASVNTPRDGLAFVLTAEGLAAARDAACAPAPEGDVDADGDGFTAAEDCDDALAWRHPGAPEVCADGVDDDCDGAVDEACGPEAAGSRGCAAVAGGGGWLLALIALARRRA